MKKILFLLLFTIASYGQAVFDEGIQITGNANSATATKVNVQEANGKVNTQTINTGFNKNIGLGGSDVVGANTLLNQYSTTPVDWTATTFASGQVVFYGGKQWIAKMATVAGDVPAVSPKWEEITFEALANKTVSVDQTIIDGSTNAVAGNAVFDGLATKAPLASPSLTGTPTAPTATAGANTTQIATTAFVTGAISTADSGNVKLTGNQTITGIKTFNNVISSSGGITVSNPTGINFLANQTTGANFNYVGQNSGTNTFTVNKFGATTATSFIKSSTPATNILLAGGGDIAQNTAFNKNFGTTAGTVVEGGTLGSNAYTSTAYLPIASPNSLNTWSSTNGFYGLHGSSVGMPSTSSYWSGIRTVLPVDNNYGLEITANIDENELYFRRYAINYKSWQKLWHDGNFNPASYLPLSGGTLSGAISGTSATFSSTVTAAPATTANQVPTWGQVQAAARPYKVYTALLSQTGTNAPTATVLENTLGGTVVWTRNATGTYYGTLNSAFPIQNKIALFQGGDMWNILPLEIIRVQWLNSNTIQILTQQATDGALVDNSLATTSIEIRVYL